MSTRSKRRLILSRNRLRRVRERLVAMPRWVKRTLMLLVDMGSVLAAVVVAVVATVPTVDALGELPWLLLIFTSLVAIPVFSALGFYQTVVRFLRSKVLVSLVAGISVMAFAVYLLGAFIPGSRIAWTTAVTFWAFALLSVAGARILVRDFLHQSGRQRERAIIYGAGVSGARLADLLLSSGDCTPVAFVDDAPSLRGSLVAGIRVYPSAAILDLIAERDVSRVLLAMPSSSRKRRAEILQALESSPVHVLSVPDMHDLVSGVARFDDLRDIDVADLLGRDPVPPDPELIAACITGRSVMVTGAGGSIGSELCRQIVRLAPRRLVLVDHSEPALYAINQEMCAALATAPDRVDIVPILGSVTESAILEQALSSFGIQTIYHAAAYKHVPLVEYNMGAGIRNNVLGTFRAAQAAEQAGVETFVLISSDKAVNPTNVMGATKRFAEIILQAMVQRGARMRICMVRFGNVLDSSGSVVPLFREQIRNGGPVTVTHPEMIRYFMTIPEAAQLVIQAGAMGGNGEVFLLDMGEPVRIVDLARKMIHLSGLKVRDTQNPEGDIEIAFTGLRPAEKLYEELLISGNAIGTDHPRIWKASEAAPPQSKAIRALESISSALLINDCDEMRSILKDVVPEYVPPSIVADQVYKAVRKLGVRPKGTVVELAGR